MHSSSVPPLPPFNCGPHPERTLYRKQYRVQLLSFFMDTSQGWPWDHCPFFSDGSGTREVKKLNQAGSFDADTLSTGALLQGSILATCWLLWSSPGPGVLRGRQR